MGSFGRDCRRTDSGGACIVMNDARWKVRHRYGCQCSQKTLVVDANIGSLRRGESPSRQMARPVEDGVLT
jgi:hypothetical protein